MKRSARMLARNAKYARLVRRNERRRLRVNPFLARRAARQGKQEAGVLPPVPRFELAPQIKIEELWPQVRFLLKAFGYPGALVTDESLVWDMVGDGRKLIAVRRKLRVPMTAKDRIFAVAQRLLEKQRKREASSRK